MAVADICKVKGCGQPLIGPIQLQFGYCGAHMCLACADDEEGESQAVKDNPAPNPSGIPASEQGPPEEVYHKETEHQALGYVTACTKLPRDLYEELRKQVPKRYTSLSACIRAFVERGLRSTSEKSGD